MGADVAAVRGCEGAPGAGQQPCRVSRWLCAGAQLLITSSPASAGTNEPGDVCTVQAAARWQNVHNTLVISPKRTWSLNLNSSPCNAESDNKKKNRSKRDCRPFAAPALFLTLCSGNVSTHWKITERAKSGHEQRACPPQLRNFSG